MPNNCVKWSDFISIFVLFYLSRLFFLKLKFKRGKIDTANSKQHFLGRSVPLKIVKFQPSASCNITSFD